MLLSRKKSKQKNAAIIAEQQHQITEDYIVPQIVKVVSLADTQFYPAQQSNNILLVDSPYEPENPPPSFIDNLHNNDEEYILGPPSEYDHDDESDIRHKFASWNLSTACQPDDRVDFFSSTSANNASKSNSSFNYKGTSFQTFQITSDQVKPSNNNGDRDASVSGSSSASYRIKSPAEEDSASETSSVCGSVPCASYLEEMNFCQMGQCNNPANKKCARCKDAFYCGEDHQKMDWKRHKVSCTPYRIQYVGIGAADELPVAAAVACRNIPAGQIIFQEKPMLVFPLAESFADSQLESVMDQPCIKSHIKNLDTVCEAARPVCAGCFNVTSGLRHKCSKCGIHLCSYNCQLITAHQVGECEAIKSLNAVDHPYCCYHTLYLDVEILRALQMEKYEPRWWEALLGMRNCVRVEAYKETERFSRFAQNIEALVPLSAKMTGYNKDLITDVHAIINSLSFRPNYNAPFKLLFSIQPQFAHDCVPNTIQYIEDEYAGDYSRLRLVTKAAVPIMRNDVISIDFTPSPYLPYEKRRQVLSDILNIPNCMCQRCQNPSVVNDLTAEIKCPQCRSGTICAENPIQWKDSVWSCRMCQEEISFSRIQEIENECKAELSLILNKNRPTIVKDLLDFISRRGSFDLNPKHHIIFLCWCFIESILRPKVLRCRSPDPSHEYSIEEIENFEIMGKYADKMLEHMDSIRPGIWVDKGIAQIHKFFYLFTHVSRSYQNGIMDQNDFITKMMQALKVLKQALQTLSVYEGCNSPSVIHLTQEATSALSALKEYMNQWMHSMDKTITNPKLPKLAHEMHYTSHR